MHVYSQPFNCIYTLVVFSRKRNNKIDGKKNGKHTLITKLVQAANNEHNINRVHGHYMKMRENETRKK